MLTGLIKLCRSQPQIKQWVKFCFAQLMSFKILLIFNCSRQHKFYSLVIFAFFMTIFCVSDIQLLVLWKCQCKCEKGWYNILQIVKTSFLNKNENAVVIFSICIEHYSKARYRDLAFKNVRQSLPSSCQLLIIWTIVVVHWTKNFTILELET